MKRFAANIALALVVTLICLAVAEVALRVLTPFPIHGKKANKIYDIDAGYRLNPKHPSIDEFGFRNRGKKDRVFAAIGDSHTYGSNVKPEESWPEQFEKITRVPTYNFGVGSYAVYAHFANAHRALEQGYKHIVIALLIHNDFKVNGNSCDIDYAKSEFWQAAQERLELTLPDCSEADNLATARAPGFIRYFRGRGQSAILSAFDYLIVKPLSEQWHQASSSYKRSAQKASAPQASKREQGQLPTEDQAEVNRKRPASAHFAGRAILNQELEFAFTDLNRKAITAGIGDFEKMLSDLKQAADAKGSKIALMFIPSKVQLFYEYLDDLDIYQSLPVLKDMAINHQKIEQRLIKHMDSIGFLWSTAKPELIEAIEKNRAEGRFVFPATGGHPFAVGYEAYAVSAKRLHERMKTD